VFAKSTDSLLRPEDVQWVAKSRIKNTGLSQVTMAHADTTSYSGGRDEEDRNLKPAWANST
jgi:hypothetical protein